MVMVMVNIALQLLPKFKFQRGPLFRETHQDMAHGVHGSQLAGTKPNAQMDTKPDIATVTIPPRLTVGVNAVEVEARA